MAVLATIVAAAAVPGIASAEGLFGAPVPGHTAAAVGGALTQGCSMQFRAETFGGQRVVRVGGATLAGPALLPGTLGPGAGVAFGGLPPPGFHHGLPGMFPTPLPGPGLGGLGPGHGLLAPAPGEPVLVTRVAGAASPGCAALHELGVGTFPAAGLGGLDRLAGAGRLGLLDHPFLAGF